MKINNLFITWQHKQPECVCIIKDDNQEGIVVAKESAFTHPTDRYEKKEGRRISLTRALQKFDKIIREQVWTKYNQTCN